MNHSEALTLVSVFIFVATYTVIAIGRIPGLRVDRTGASLAGASLMVACGVLSLDEAERAIDLDTLVLLLGMMIVVAHLKLSGFFRLVNGWVLRRTHRPVLILAAVLLTSGFFSAFLVNDTICLVMTPLVFDLVKRLKRNPVPYLLAVAMASNIGSTATITGNPQNIMIGSFSHIAYGKFAAALSPVAAIGLAIAMAMIALYFRRHFTVGVVPLELPLEHYSRALVIKSVAITAAMVVFFFLGQPVAKVAIAAGGLLLLTRRVKPQKVYHEIHFSLLVLFAGLFVVAAGIQKPVFTPETLAYAKHLHLERVAVISALAAVLSNIVSNVPAVLVLKPFIEQLTSHRDQAWLALAKTASKSVFGNTSALARR